MRNTFFLLLPLLTLTACDSNNDKGQEETASSQSQTSEDSTLRYKDPAFSGKVWMLRSVTLDGYELALQPCKQDNYMAAIGDLTFKMQDAGNKCNGDEKYKFPADNAVFEFSQDHQQMKLLGQDGKDSIVYQITEYNEERLIAHGNTTDGKVHMFTFEAKR